MQVIAVERWTFWAAMLALIGGFGVSAISEPNLSAFSGTSYDIGPAVFSLALVLFLVSVAVGGSADPSVRRIPEEPPARAG
jgi:hypothetical protein